MPGGDEAQYETRLLGLALHWDAAALLPPPTEGTSLPFACRWIARVGRFRYGIKIARSTRPMGQLVVIVPMETPVACLGFRCGCRCSDGDSQQEPHVLA